tara:strand:- start:12099 stop:12323 length:225 start_codon:yes stop_codon:yes gene_type:complete
MIGVSKRVYPLSTTLEKGLPAYLLFGCLLDERFFCGVLWRGFFRTKTSIVWVLIGFNRGFMVRLWLVLYEGVWC